MFKYCFALLIMAMPLGLRAQQKIINTQFLVSGNCAQCKDRIETAVWAMGVNYAKWNVETKSLQVKFDSTKTSVTAIQKKLAAIGHDTEMFTATPEKYASLPDCCLYRNEENTAPHSEASYLPLIRGIVFEESNKGVLSPVLHAAISNLNTGEIVITDSLGMFLLPGSFPIKISISYVGHQPDTVHLQQTTPLVQITLKRKSNGNLENVVIVSKNNNTYISKLSTLNTTNMGLKELAKAACCNLSESFETNPAIDISFADAITGIRQIKLIGLSGKYAQITTESVPSIRGLNGSYGLTFVPGPWLAGIQLTKGTGSVVNGYESISGQINVELVKPNESDKWYINGYANSMGRLETSVNYALPLNNQWHTSLLTHYNNSSVKNDFNKDGFLDNPLGHQINLINRWLYQGSNGLVFHLDIKGLQDKRQSGQVDFNENKDKLTANNYGLGIKINQYELVTKLGYLFPGNKYKSIGIMLSAKNYNNDAYYGLNKYDAKNNSLYANVIFQNIIGNTAHKYRAGFSFLQDDYQEKFDTAAYHRKESVPGVFVEYTFSPSTKFSLIAGYRFDVHNLYGAENTVRLHVKYDVAKNTTLRFTGGSGFKTANIFAENIGWFASSRSYAIIDPTNRYGYGLAPEKAWNFGMGWLQKFTLNNLPATFSLDVYRTNFLNQVVTDIDASSNQILFYNLANKSFSNSVQAEVNVEPIKKLEVRFAYRYLKAVTKYKYANLTEALSAPHRLFANFGYEIFQKWKFDYTLNWNSKKRLPNSSADVNNKELNNYSPNYVQMNTQVTRLFGHHWEVYLGVENLTNFTQHNAVKNPQQPFAPGFDAAQVWGPINERTIYAGFRFKLHQ